MRYLGREVVAKARWQAGRSAPLPVLDLDFTHWPDTGVRALERHLRCQHCGRKGWATIRVEWFE